MDITVLLPFFTVPADEEPSKPESPLFHRLFVGADQPE